MMVRRLLLAATLCAWGPIALAGQTCQAQALTAAEIDHGMTLAQTTAQALEATGAQVVVLGRAGQDLSRYGQRWSHLGLAYREPGPTPLWRVVHKLNTCGTAQAQLYRQGLGEFFLDRPARYEAVLAVPTPAVQARLLPLLRGPTAALARWHTPRYNMLAYPWDSPYQQCNQWLLETLAGSLDDRPADPALTPRRRAQAWLKAQGYTPAVLTVDAPTRLGARIGAPHISFDDQPFMDRVKDRITTLTADSALAWLQRSGLAQAPRVLP
jgi:hypothetical protein